MPPYYPLPITMKTRFRGFMPVVVDVETAGLAPEKHALLEIAALTLRFNATGQLEPDTLLHEHVIPFPGSERDPAALAVNHIDPDHPFRFAKSEKLALEAILTPVRAQMESYGCTRAVLVGHNAFFDLGFLNAAAARAGIKNNPFHRFTSFDTATLAGVALGQTVLAKACEKLRIAFEEGDAHSAIYDTKKTAELFCAIVNRFQFL